jgi:hypothetical protein
MFRVRNGRGFIEARKLVDAWLRSLALGEKGMIYCTSYAKYKALAWTLRCYYYYGNLKDSDTYFFA